MNPLRSLGDALATVGSALLERFVAFVPSVLGAVLLLLVGWILARLLRVLAARAALLLDTLLARVGGPAGAERLRMGRASGVLGAVVFWVVLLFFATAATQVLGLQTFTDWLARLIDYLPTLAAGVLIVVAGYVLSRFVGDLVRATATRLDTAQRSVLARLTQVAILVGAVLVGADQIGIRVTFLAIFAAAAAAAVVGGLAIAVGLGARDHIANLIGAHHPTPGVRGGTDDPRCRPSGAGSRSHRRCAHPGDRRGAGQPAGAGLQRAAYRRHHPPKRCKLASRRSPWHSSTRILRARHACWSDCRDPRRPHCSRVCRRAPADLCSPPCCRPRLRVSSAAWMTLRRSGC